MAITEEYVLFVMLQLMHMTNRTLSSQNIILRYVRSVFVFSPNVVAETWNMLWNQNLIPRRSSIKHLLWYCAYCKSYMQYEMYCVVFECSLPTFHKWVWTYAGIIAQLEVVSTNICFYLNIRIYLILFF